MLRAICYYRVSRDEQAEKGGYPRQEEACHAYAAKHGYTIIREYYDDISGEYRIADRPEGAKLYHDVLARQADAILYEEHTRISRRKSPADFNLFQEACQENSIALISVERGIIPGVAGEVMDVIEQNAAAQEKAHILKRTKDGRLDVVRSGRPVYSGSAPYGYCKHGKREDSYYTIEPTEKRAVLEIFKKYTQEGYSLRQICRHLDRIGAPLPQAIGVRKRAAQWLPATVRGILLNSIYKGLYYYGKTRNENPHPGITETLRRRTNPVKEWKADQWVELPDLVIVDPETWDKAQSILSHNKETRRKETSFVLSGFLRCGGCGYKWVGHTHRRNIDGRPRAYREYLCGTISHKENRDPCGYGAKTISADKLEKIVWGIVEAQLSQNPEVLQEQIENQRASNSTRTDELKARIANIEGVIRQTYEKLDNVAAGFGNAKPGSYLANKLQADADHLEEKIKDLQAELSDTRRQLEEVDIPIDRIMELYQDLILEVISEFTDEERAALSRFASVDVESIVDARRTRKLYNDLKLEVTIHYQNGERWIEGRTRIGGFTASLCLSQSKNEDVCRPGCLDRRRSYPGNPIRCPHQ